MKRFKILLIAMIFALTGGVLGGGVFADEVVDPTPKPIEIFTASEFIENVGANYDKNFTFVLKDNLDFTGLSIAFASNTAFQGTLDGNGFTISNLTFASNGRNYGLFPYAMDALIKNLKIAGSVIYDFNQDITEICAGAFVGEGERVTIKNCELASSATISSEKENPDSVSSGIVVSKKFTYGGLAGELRSSTVTNCVTQVGVDVEATTVGNQIFKIGGIVGDLSVGSNVTYAISYAGVSYMSKNAATFYNGGIAGEVSGESKIYNCVHSSGEQDNNILPKADEANNAVGVDGALIGVKGEASTIRYSYFLDRTTKAVGNIEEELNKVGRVNELTTSFLTASGLLETDPQYPRWNPQDLPWNLGSVWIAKSIGVSNIVRMELQCFQTFEYSFSNVLDQRGLLEEPKFSGEGITPVYPIIKDDEGNDVIDTTGEPVAYRFKYGADITISVRFKDDNYNFYNVTGVLHDGVDLQLTDKEISKDNAGRYEIHITSSDMTDGMYSFACTPIQFNSVFATANPEHGEVKYRGGVPTSSLTLNWTVESNAQTLDVEYAGVYSFSHWQVYYRAERVNDAGETVVDWVDANKKFNDQVITVKIGATTEQESGNIKYFDRDFKLEAVFTSEGAINVTFNNDKNIESIQFSGKDFEGESILVSGNANRIEMVVVVKEGYEIQLDRFLNAIKTLYGKDSSGQDKDISSVMPKDPEINENNQREYHFFINMSYIKNNLNPKDVTFNVFTTRESKNNGSNLLWLWITLPIVGVLIIAGIVLYFVLRRYFYLKRATSAGAVPNKKGGKVKEKKPDFKDYYY